MNILLPALSPTMEQGNLVKWLVKEGQQVNSGDILAQIETDKATMELESPDDGIIQKIIVEEGAENISVNSPIAVLKVEGEDEDSSSNPIVEEKSPGIPKKLVKSKCPTHRQSTPSTEAISLTFSKPCFVSI